MAPIAAHLKAGVILVVTISDRYIATASPTSIPPPLLLLPVRNKPYGFCGR